MLILNKGRKGVPIGTRIKVPGTEYYKEKTATGWKHVKVQRKAKKKPDEKGEKYDSWSWIAKERNISVLEEYMKDQLNEIEIMERNLDSKTGVDREADEDLISHKKLLGRQVLYRLNELKKEKKNPDEKRGRPESKEKQFTKKFISEFTVEDLIRRGAGDMSNSFHELINRGWRGNENALAKDWVEEVYRDLGVENASNIGELVIKNTDEENKDLIHKLQKLVTNRYDLYTEVRNNKANYSDETYGLIGTTWNMADSLSRFVQQSVWKKKNGADLLKKDLMSVDDIFFPNRGGIQVRFNGVTLTLQPEEAYNIVRALTTGSKREKYTLAIKNSAAYQRYETQLNKETAGIIKEYKDKFNMGLTITDVTDSIDIRKRGALKKLKAEAAKSGADQRDLLLKKCNNIFDKLTEVISLKHYTPADGKLLNIAICNDARETAAGTYSEYNTTINIRPESSGAISHEMGHYFWERSKPMQAEFMQWVKDSGLEEQINNNTVDVRENMQDWDNLFDTVMSSKVSNLSQSYLISELRTNPNPVEALKGDDVQPLLDSVSAVMELFREHGKTKRGYFDPAKVTRGFGSKEIQHNDADSISMDDVIHIIKGTAKGTSHLDAIVNNVLMKSDVYKNRNKLEIYAHVQNIRNLLGKAGMRGNAYINKIGDEVANGYGYSLDGGASHYRESRDYWKTPTEIFARTFRNYVAMKGAGMLEYTVRNMYTPEMTELKKFDGDKYYKIRDEEDAKRKAFRDTYGWQFDGVDPDESKLNYNDGELGKILKKYIGEDVLKSLIKRARMVVLMKGRKAVPIGTKIAVPGGKYYREKTATGWKHVKIERKGKVPDAEKKKDKAEDDTGDKTAREKELYNIAKEYVKAKEKRDKAKTPEDKAKYSKLVDDLMAKGKSKTEEYKSKYKKDSAEKKSEPVDEAKKDTQDYSKLSIAEKTKLAGEWGKKDFADGKPNRMPMKVLELLTGMEPGEGTEIMEAWNSEWHKANSDAPVDAAGDKPDEPPKKRGRPKGAKNKKGTKPEEPKVPDTPKTPDVPQTPDKAREKIVTGLVAGTEVEVAGMQKHAVIVTKHRDGTVTVKYGKNNKIKRIKISKVTAVKAATDPKVIDKAIKSATPETRTVVDAQVNGGDISQTKVPEKYDFKPSKTKVAIVHNGITGSNTFIPDIECDDYTSAEPLKINLVSEKQAMAGERPSYIPEIKPEVWNNLHGRVVATKLDDGNFLLLIDKESGYSSSFTNKSAMSGKTFAKVSLEVLCATQDYYSKNKKVTEKKAYQDAMDKVSKKLDDAVATMDDYIKNPAKYDNALSKYEIAKLNQLRDIGLNDKARATYIKSATRNDRPNKAISDNRYTTTEEALHLVFTRLTKNGRRDSAGAHNELMEAMHLKSNDMAVQFDENFSVYHKGEETSYGDKGTKDTILKSHGVKVKRQNGAEISDKEIKQVTTALDSVFGVFGNRAEMARKFGLKISHSGEVGMHARKAIGIYFPHFKAIGVSFADGHGGMTLAHEWSHFMDNHVGNATGQHYASDDWQSTGGKMAVKLRQELKGSGNYAKRTCECFARSMESYYTYKTGGDDAANALHTAYTEQYYPKSLDYMKKEIYPLCEQWIKENENFLKSMPVRMVIFEKSKMSEKDIIENMEQTGKYKKGMKKTWTKEQEIEGMKVEMEHTDNPLIAKQIAMDHLIEDSDYYTKLKKMENE